MAIKHLVLSGGGAKFGFYIFGILTYAIKNNMLNINDIESLYCTSAGSLAGPLLGLKLDIDTICDWLINRPWENVLNFDPDAIISGYTNGGILERSVVDNLYGNLLLSQDLSKDITLQEYYNYNNIEIHIQATALTNNDCYHTDFSYKTHPNTLLLDAIYMSSSIPIICKPIIKENIIYYDGGLWSNTPFSEWRNHYKDVDLKEVLIVQAVIGNENITFNAHNQNLFNLLMLLIRNYTRKNNSYNEEIELAPYKCLVDLSQENIGDFFDILSDRNSRQQIINELSITHIAKAFSKFKTDCH